MSEEKPIQGHEYDGIEEYDNPLPMWWLATFFGAIIFAYIYWIHELSGAALTQQQELAADMQQIQELQKRNAPKPESDEDLAKAVGGGTINLGRETFAGKCAVCHGKNLEGGIGPNLTDEFWLHGEGRPSDIAKLIRSGVTDKGMPAWDNVLKPEEVQAVTVYVAAAKGSNPPGAKAPQGKKIGN